MKPLSFHPSGLKYTGMVGTGGIGTGKFFKLNGNHTLGREESRSGQFLDVNDYCKQHIILHYVSVLLGHSFSVTPIGKVGDDDAGRSLLEEMRSAGLVLDHVQRLAHLPTLFSFCFHYPDGSGGNFTTDNSASANVDKASIDAALEKIKALGPRGMIMAAPEVPMDARRRLLELGKAHGLFCSASFTSGEIREAMTSGMMRNVDLLAINVDEASAATGIDFLETDFNTVALSVIQALQQYNKDIQVAVTGGHRGSQCWNGTALQTFPIVETDVVSTAGAGDAFFSGLLCGLALGLTLFEAQQLATLVAGLSVTSPHTIHKGIDRESLKTFLKNSSLTFSENIIKLLED